MTLDLTPGRGYTAFDQNVAGNMIKILILYDFLLCLALPLAFPYFWWRRLVRGKPVPAFRQRLALDQPESPPPGSESVWIHAVSVGEVQVVAPLVARIEAERPGTVIYLSTVTPTGQATAHRLFGDRVRLFYCPFDLPGPVARILATVRPVRLIIAETELWPNLLWKTHRAGIPIHIVNGRISDRAYPRYRRVRSLLAPFLALPRHVLVQTAGDAERFRTLGATAEQTEVTGNMKFDSLREIRPDDALCETIRAALGATAEPVIVAGSTMAGEEQLLAETLSRLRQTHPEVRLVVAPRHPERFAEATEVFARAGFEVRRRTSLEGAAATTRADVVILDTIGELAAVYALATVVFVGGTLVPAGGHNVLEPASVDRPVVVGPSMENFREILDVFRGADALRQVTDVVDLATALGGLLDDPAECQRLVDNARTLIAANQGATGRNFERIFGRSPAGP